MQELPYFIKTARSSLGANGSKFVDYHEFLKCYKKDSDGLNFDTEARNAGYYDGYDAMKDYPNIFQLHGNLIRRADTEGISHITNAIDRSKKTAKKGSKKPLVMNRTYAAQSSSRNFGSARNAGASNSFAYARNVGASNSFASTNNFGATRNVGTTNGFGPTRNVGYTNGSGATRNVGSTNGFGATQNIGSASNFGASRNYETTQNYESTRNVGSTNNFAATRNVQATQNFQATRNVGATQNVQATQNVTSANNFGTTRNVGLANNLGATKNAESTNGFGTTRNVPSAASKFGETQNVPSAASKFGETQNVPSAASKFGEMQNVLSAASKFGEKQNVPSAASKFGQTQNVASVSSFGYDSRTFAEVLEKVGGNVFNLFMDIYNQGLKEHLKPEMLRSIIKMHKMDSNFSLNKLKCFLTLYFAKSFNVFTVDSESISVTSKNEKPKNEYQFLCHMFKRKIKQQKLSGSPVCQVIGADVDKVLYIYLRPFIWIDSYRELTKELKHYASMIEMLKPIEFVFKSDRALYYDNGNGKFYRCLVLSEAGQGKVNVFLNDEFRRLDVATSSLYKLPTRFYAFHDMCFGLRMDNLAADKVDVFAKCLNSCSAKDHSVPVSIDSFEDVKNGANIYSGKFGKITTTVE